MESEERGVGILLVLELFFFCRTSQQLSPRKIWLRFPNKVECETLFPIGNSCPFCNIPVAVLFELYYMSDRMKNYFNGDVRHSGHFEFFYQYHQEMKR